MGNIDVVGDFPLKVNDFLFALDDQRGRGCWESITRGVKIKEHRGLPAAPAASDMKDAVIHVHVHLNQKTVSVCQCNMDETAALRLPAGLHGIPCIFHVRAARTCIGSSHRPADVEKWSYAASGFFSCY